MSASREKKTRQDLSGSGWNDPKTAREAKQRQKEHSTNLLYGTIGVVFLVIAIAAVIWKSNIIPKTATAATVNGEKYTAAEVNFYFENYYQNFVNGNYSILSMIGLDTGTSLKDQTISSSAVMFVTDATEGETWYDYFADKALEQLAGVQAMNAAAEAEGFTWNDEMQADLDDTMESLASAASTYGYTEKQYLGLIYGSTMTRSIYEEQTRRSLLATAYLQSYQDSLTYSTDELEAAYQEDRTAYDLVDCAYVRVNGAAADTDEEGNSIEVTDEMKAEAMAAAKTTADAIYAAYKAGTSLEDAAAEYESTATYASSDSFSYSSSVLGEWLYDDARQAGDSAVLEDSDSSNYYVVVFNGRSRNEYNTVNVRHILIQPEASELSEDDEGYEDDVAAKDAEAAQKAMLAHAKNGEGLEQITPIVQRARDQYIQLAQQMGMSKEEAEASADAYGLNTDKLRDLIVQSSIASGQTGDLQAAFDRLGLSTSDVKLKVDNMVGSMRLIPAEKTTTVRVNDLASNAIHTIREGIELLQSKTVTIRTNVITNETTIRSTKGSMIGRPTSYTGGYYAGNGFAMRGYYGGGIVEGLLPGTPPLSAQADNITLANARLRSGEFVSNDKSVRYYGADTYAAMNRRQLPREMFTGGAEQPGPSVADISQGVMDALERTSVTLVFDDRTVAARLAPAMDRELGRRKGMGL